jgi:hypothetical protein
MHHFGVTVPTVYCPDVCLYDAQVHDSSFPGNIGEEAGKE